jgi:hypothetical protein
MAAGDKSGKEFGRGGVPLLGSCAAADATGPAAFTWHAGASKARCQPVWGGLLRSGGGGAHARPHV